MNFRLIALVAVAALSLQLCATLVDKLPAPEYVDTEVSAHYPLQQPENVDNLDFSLVFNATASNNVEVAFGADADGDGKLALDETEMIIGWDCGRYFIENFKAGEIVEEAAADTGVRRSLNWHYRIYGNRATLKSFAATNETGVVFAELSAAKPQWLYSCNWNLMRLTARGIDAQNEAFDVDISRKGIVIILR
jgi:hypothetical protein